MIIYLILCMFIAVIPGVGWGQQEQQSCEEQLSQMQTTLMFTRAGRNGVEENAGRVVTTLQRQINTLQQEIETFKKAQKAMKIDQESLKEQEEK